MIKSICLGSVLMISLCYLLVGFSTMAVGGMSRIPIQECLETVSARCCILVCTMLFPGCMATYRCPSEAVRTWAAMYFYQNPVDIGYSHQL